MGKSDHVKTFDDAARAEYRSTITRMRILGESTHALGEQTYRHTGQLPSNVDIRGKVRLSHNASVLEDGVYRMVNGPKCPSAFVVDGTSSMGQNLERALHAMEQLFDLLTPLRQRYQTDVAFGVVQDVNDPHPVVQLAQFESDDRVVTHLRELVPSFSGGDSTEDYDLGVLYLDRFVQADIFDFYGLRGLAVITGDEIGRGSVSASDVKRHLGHSMPEQEISTSEICKSLLEHWHGFYVQVGRNRETTEWWSKRLGSSRVILAPDADYLAYVWAGLAYITETAQPTLPDFRKFVGNSPISDREAQMIWQWLSVAEQHFGAQTRLQGYSDIPKPGDVLAHPRHAWPIGHPRADENITPPEEQVA